MSGHFVSLLLGRIRFRWPASRPAFLLATGAASATIGKVKRAWSTFDVTAALIRSADAIEAGFAMIFRGVRLLFGSRGLGLTAGLLWRGLAALTGIGLTATLVTALSAAGGSDANLASLTIQPAPDLRPVRDVRLEPRQQAALGDDWLKITRPIAMFGLEAPELDRQSPLYEAMRSQDGARRQDTLSFGAFESDKPHLRLRLLVAHGAQAQAQPFVIALVREASERGMSIQRSGVPAAIETRFGAVETADATLSDGAASRTCIAFRKSNGDLPLALSGWWCGAANRPADRQQLTCLIDRLDLLGAGEDKALRAAFSRTELNRQPACAPPRLSASGRKASWLDADGQAPALKTATRR